MVNYLFYLALVSVAAARSSVDNPKRSNSGNAFTQTTSLSASIDNYSNWSNGVRYLKKGKTESKKEKKSKEPKTKSPNGNGKTKKTKSPSVTVETTFDLSTCSSYETIWYAFPMLFFSV